MTPAASFAWTTGDPQALVTRLRSEGIEVRGSAFGVGPITVRIERGSDERLATLDEARTRRDDPDRAFPSPGWAVLAVAHATVDTERALAEVAAAGAGADDLAGAGPRPRDAVLGARVTLLRADPVPIALVEPDIEGRLAAMLARHGEGPVGLYLVRTGPDMHMATQDGPFGPQRVLAHGSMPWSPVLLRVVPGSHPEGTGTIPG